MKSLWSVVLLIAIPSLAFCQTSEQLKTTCYTLAALTAQATLHGRGYDVILYERAAAGIRANPRANGCESEYFKTVIKEAGPFLARTGAFVSLGAIEPIMGWSDIDMKTFVNMTTDKDPERVIHDLDVHLEPMSGWSENDLRAFIEKTEGKKPEDILEAVDSPAPLLGWSASQLEQFKLKTKGKTSSEIINMLNSAADAEHLKAQNEALQKEIDKLRSQVKQPSQD